MSTPLRLFGVALFLALALAAAGPVAAENWPAWRGPEGNGQSKEGKPPLKWSPTEHVRWKTPLPEPGNSTPVLWGNRIFLTQSTEQGRKRSLLCLERKEGKVMWQRTVEYAQSEPTHSTNPYGSASPVTDGQCVVASFGSAGIACWDFEGRELWRRDLGKCLHVWGNAASPVLWGDLVFLNFGPGERTFLAAFDKKSGKEVWRAEEPGGKFGKEPADWIGSWSTPAAVRLPGGDELIMTWPGAVKSYRPSTGELLWTCKGLEKEKSPNWLVYTSPLVSGDLVVAMGGFSGSALAVRAGGSGDVTGSHRLWRVSGCPQRIGSGVVVGEHIYVVNEPGTCQCIELKTGKVLWTERAGGNVWASLVHADGRLYVTTLDGETIVLAANPSFEVLARNALKERTLASPAIAGTAVLLRTYRHLWCIE